MALMVLSSEATAIPAVKGGLILKLHCLISTFRAICRVTDLSIVSTGHCSLFSTSIMRSEQYPRADRR